MGNTVSIEKAKGAGRQAMLLHMHALTEEARALKMGEEAQNAQKTKKLELNENSDENGR